MPRKLNQILRRKKRSRGVLFFTLLCFCLGVPAEQTELVSSSILPLSDMCCWNSISSVEMYCWISNKLSLQVLKGKTLFGDLFWAQDQPPHTSLKHEIGAGAAPRFSFRDRLGWRYPRPLPLLAREDALHEQILSRWRSNRSAFA